MELVALVTIFMCLQLTYFMMNVGGARGKSGVSAPATTGDEIFERHYRVHMNTIEQLVITLPLLWVAGSYFDAQIAAGLGLVFIVGRFMYAAGYVKEPVKRGAGMGIGSLATLGLLGCSLWGVISGMLA
ncbi:MAG: MAPEG family protein [Pseudomonadales bacterium]